MTIKPVKIGGDGVLMEFCPQQFEDERGSFSEVYNKETLAKSGIDIEFVQDNQSISRARGTVRGLHFQRPPFAQAKLVRVVQGAILDVALDIRQGSPTFGQHASAVISAEAFNQLLVPVGFAHGFCTLEPDTVVLYKASAVYSREHEGGVLWCDPDLDIAWPVSTDAAVLSQKDRDYPRLRDLPHCFDYEPAASRSSESISACVDRTECKPAS